MKNKKLFLINLIYYVSMLLVTMVFILNYMGIITSSLLSSILIQIVIISGLPIIMYSLIVSKNIKNTFSDFGFKKISKKILCLIIILAILLYFVNLFVANCFSSLISLFGFETQLPALNISNKDLLLEFGLTAILPGICEEILHRGLFLNANRKLGYTRYGLIFSSILFGLLHLNIMQFFYAAILGFCMGLTVVITDSIWSSVIIHFTNNFLSIYFSFNKNLPFQNLYSYLMEQLINLNPIYFIIVTTLLMIGLIYLVLKILKSLKIITSKEKAVELAKEIYLDNTSIEVATEKIDEINKEISLIENNTKLQITDEGKIGFSDNIFLYCSLFLGICGTLISFVAGIL